MQCTAADLKDSDAHDGLVGYAVKYVVITGVIQLIDSVSIIVDDGWCGLGWDELLSSPRSPLMSTFSPKSLLLIRTIESNP